MKITIEITDDHVFTQVSQETSTKAKLAIAIAELEQLKLEMLDRYIDCEPLMEGELDEDNTLP